MIPRIDFEKLMGNDSDSLALLEKGVRNIGVFIIYNTPISTDDVTKTLNIYKEFFLLPAAVKNKVSMAKTGSNRGWGNSQGEQVNPNYNPDFKEVFDNGLEIDRDDPLSKLSVYSKNIWPDQPKEFSQTILSYYNKAMALSNNILTKISKTIGNDDYYFKDKFEKPMALLRGNFYPKRPNWAGKRDFGIASHTDYGCLTLLASDGTSGLEILNLDNKWLEVQFTPGEFVINFGEMLQMWSNNKVKATQHRVRGNENERISIPLFFNPSFYTNIAPQNSGDKITAGDYLTKRYNETYIHLKNKNKSHECD